MRLIYEMEKVERCRQISSFVELLSRIHNNELLQSLYEAVQNEKDIAKRD